MTDKVMQSFSMNENDSQAMRLCAKHPCFTHLRREKQAIERTVKPIQRTKYVPARLVYSEANVAFEHLDTHPYLSPSAGMSPHASRNTSGMSPLPGPSPVLGDG